MTFSNVVFTRKEYDIIARSRGIKEPQKMSTEELLNALSRYDSKRKVETNRRKLLKMKLEKIAKKQNISRNELRKVEKLQDKSIDELQGIAKLRGIKNYDNLTKEDLIFILLKSESSPAERHYMKYFNNSTNDKIKSKINYIRIILSRLGNIVTKNERKKIKKEFYEIEKKDNLSDNEKKKIYNDLVKLQYKNINRDDLDYFGIRELENLFTNDDDDFYEPILIRSSFEKNYEYYEIRGDKDKKLSIKQYLYLVMPGLADLINKKKNDRIECKIELSMGVNFISTNDTGEIRTFYVQSDNGEIRLGNETPEIITELIKSFLSTYQKEENILRNESNLVFDSVDLLTVHIHKINLKRGKSCIKSPDWIFSKRATINPKNKDKKCF